MTNPGPPLSVPDDDGLDAAASAVADGVATPEEAAAVAAAPDGPARVAAMRAVADAVGSPVGAQDPQTAAAALAAALAAFDAGVAQADDGGDSAPGTAPEEPGSPVPAGAQVTSLRPPGSRPGRGLSPLAAVAAALVLLVGLAALSVAVLRSGGEDDAATSTALAPSAAPELGPSVKYEGAAAAPDAAGQQQPPSTAAPGAESGVAAPTQAAPAAAAAARLPVVDGGDIGRQDDLDALVQRTAVTLDGVPDPAVAAPGAAPPRDVQACIATGAATAGERLGPLRYRAVGTYEGQAAVFLAFDRSDQNPPRLLLVLARSGCAVLASTHF